jgi:regulator of sirC expression with transglutaminase-like and TPR domain
VLRVQPNRVEAMVLRAAANRQLDKTDLAEDDVARALALDPAFPDALLERGMLRRLKGRDAEARADWMKVLELVPETSVADSARAQLEKMDVKTK